MWMVTFMRSPNQNYLSAFFLCFIASAISPSQSISQTLDQVLNMELTQLMQMDVVVTSVNKRPQKLHEAASAIYVLTNEDIRRSGAVNIMEALRMVPGVLVSKINQNRYAVSVRGFNRRFSDKLLVLIDGRTVYSPSDSGVFWIGQDTVLEDIDRIEVIRGPGAALWGSNAVAGVINITTKSANETQGVMLAGGAGTEERGFGTLRYGGKLGENFSYRVYGKYKDRDAGKNVDGSNAFDDKQMGQGGFRSDWQVTPKDHLTMQGDYYSLESQMDFKSTFVSITQGNVPFKGANIQRGANFLSRWTREMEDSSSFMFQVYYDRLERESQLPFDNTHDQVDFEFQHNLLLGERQKFSWGLNYRFVHFNFMETNVVKGPLEEDTNLYGFFVHDEISIIPDRWNVIIGSKFEHNQFSGFEYQPNIRTLWTPQPNHSFWAAASRAVRIPDVVEEKGSLELILIPLGPPPCVAPGGCLLLRQQNDGRTEAEELLAFEVGYRHQIPSKNLSFDITGYLFKYENLIEPITTPALSFGNPSAFPAFVSVSLNENAVDGDIYGVELGTEWKPNSNWRLSGSYTFTKADMETVHTNLLNNSANFQAENEPQHLFNIRSYLQLPHNLEFDSMLYYVSKNSSKGVKSYTRLDLRLGWKPQKNFELSLVGQNLLEDQHSETTDSLENFSETERSFYAKATFRF
jgi:iron complex outermembrane receptor protein